jgi:aspartyl-tRNA(Asn)/glutamyl-tRNA(Gln) amidotransferase subunit C
MPSPEIPIRHVATLARLELTDEEAARYQEQIGQILHYIDVLGRHNLEGVEPTSHALPVLDVIRADEARPGFSQAEALANAPRRAMDQFQIPKVLE